MSLLPENTWLLLIFIFALGLIFGSFLNVLIYRLPIMLEQQWRLTALQFIRNQRTSQKIRSKPFNLWLPHSHCSHCHKPLRWYENIPLVSYILQQGKCRHCKHGISISYFVVELLATLLTVIVFWKYKLTLTSGAFIILTWLLIAVSMIDLKHMLVPDILTLPLLWLGLLFNALGFGINITDAVFGAIIGYLSLWIINFLYRLLRKRDGIGNGDFKLLALAGAWFGWQAIPLILFLSSISGSIIGIALVFFMEREAKKPIPFAPFIALAIFIYMMLFGFHPPMYLTL